MNDFYRTLLNNNIKKALVDAETASKINHPYLIGKLRELFVDSLLQPMLNNNYSVSSGKAFDYDGNLSSEIDLCIYSKNLLPPIFFSSKDNISLLPIESVLNAIEVKSNFSKGNIEDAFNKFIIMDRKLICTSGFHDAKHEVIPYNFIKPHYSLFFFNYGHKQYSPDKILDIYKQIDSNWKQAPLITNICIANKGWLCNTSKGWIHISYDQNTNINEEIIGFLGTLVNDLPNIEASRGTPRIGYYLTDPLNIDLFIDNKFVSKPWGDGKFIFTNK